MNSLRPLAVVAGPTASGKTALAVELAKRLNGEVVSADSMQVYELLRIGTARPTEEEMGGVPHHLLGFLPLSVPYSVAQYSADAHAVMAQVEARGRLPILCGGTGLYIQAVTENLVFSEQAGDPDLRAALRERASREGGAVLLEELRRVDPVTAARLHPHDIGRIVRALEVYAVTGRTLTEQNRLSREGGPLYQTAGILLDFRDRQVLYDRINRRVDRMLEQGLLQEAEQVLSSEQAPTAMQAIGYKELAPYFRGEISLPEAVEKLKRETRRYAKRQLSWFRRMPLQTLYVDDMPDGRGLTEQAEQAVTAMLGIERRTSWIPLSND